MVIVIDTDTEQLEFDQLTQLEGVEYTFSFAWSTAQNCWYLSLLDQNGEFICAGIKLVCGLRNLLNTWGSDPRTPPGNLFVADLGGLDRDIAAPDELNNNFPLCYITSDDEALA